MTEKPKTERLPRYRRKKGAFQQLVIRQVDRNILGYVFAHRFLDTELLSRLLGVDAIEAKNPRLGKDGKSRPARYGFGTKALYKRLQGLFHAGYLDRHFITDQPMGSGNGSPRAIYGLGPKSAPLLAEMAGVPVRDIRDIVQSNKVKSPFLRHALELATFRVILELACGQSDGRVKVLFWEQGQILRDFVEGLNERGEQEQFSVYPDAFFCLGVEGKGKANYFLELDRGTMPIVSKGRRPDIRKKLFGYWYYYRQKKHAKRYFYRAMPDGQVVGLEVAQTQERSYQLEAGGADPVRGFRALFLVPGMIERGGAVHGRLGNIIASVRTFHPVIHPSTTLFWFASSDDFPLDKPESVLSPAWITPKPEQHMESLIE